MKNLMLCCVLLLTFQVPSVSTRRRNRRPKLPLMNRTSNKNEKSSKIPLMDSEMSVNKNTKRSELPLFDISSSSTNDNNNDKRSKLPLMDPPFTSKDPTKKERRIILPSTRRRTFNNSICKLCKYMYTLSSAEFAKTNNNRTFCIHLLQVQNCISDLREERIPCGFLETMVIKGASRIQWRRNKCAVLDVSADDLDNVMKEDKAEPDVGLNCRYMQSNQNLSRTMHCGMFGDPHVKTFFDVRQTCIVAGDWTLMENDFMKVQVTNEIVQNTESTTATATNKVSIVLKEIDLVCSERKEYEGTSQYLPGKFKDGSSITGPKHCQTEIHKYSEKQVSITSCRTNTTLVIRRVGKYLTFNVKTPYEIVNKSSGLCFSGCPSSELVDYKSFFENKIQETHDELPTKISDVDAMELCSQKNLTDFYYDSCVFDLLTTGDKQFSKAAAVAMFDAINMDPRLRLRRENSIVLKVFEEVVTNTLASSQSSSSARTIQGNGFYFLLTILFCILHNFVPLR